MAATRAAQNKKIRQESLREMLAERCRLQHVLENVKKMEEQGAEMEPQQLQALKYATETRLKLINKYLPDLKSTEITNAEGETFKIDNKFTVEFINADEFVDASPED